MMKITESNLRVARREYLSTFFQKLAADHGIRPETEEEAINMLILAGQLAGQLADQDQEKQASSQNNAPPALDHRIRRILVAVDENRLLRQELDRRIRRILAAVDENR